MVAREGLYVANCEFGKGLFAGRNFQKGEWLFRFSGPVIGSAAASAKGETEGNVLQVGPTTYIDLEPPGVFINHSCNPNSGIRNHIEVFALQSIQVGEELRFDYSTTMSERRWTMRCHCGTSQCRGLITDFHELPPEIQERYLALGIVQTFIVQEMERNSKWRSIQGSTNAFPCC